MRIPNLVTLSLVVAALAGCITESSPNITHTAASMTEASKLNTQLGFDHMRNGRRADAVLKFEKAIEQDPDNANAYLGLAMINDQEIGRAHV